MNMLYRIRNLFSSLLFRLKHSIFRGVVRSDFQSCQLCIIGDFSKFRGTLSVHNSMIRIGDNCAVAISASIGAENNKSKILVGNNVSFGPRTIVSSSESSIDIGSNTSFFSDCIISGNVIVGKNCLFANNVTVLSGTHQIYGTGTIRENDKKYVENFKSNQQSSIVIGDDCWLGSNSVILPGVTLGDGVVVGANEVVTKSFPEYSIIGGVPASIIGSRLTEKSVVKM